MVLKSGHITIDGLASTPIMHGAGAKSNVQVIRTMPILMPDGTIRHVPFVSGNSIKHCWIRDAGVRWALDAMGVSTGLSKELVDLLFSGGHLSATGSGSVDLQSARKVCELFPILGLCGYSAGNRIETSKITVDHLMLACKESAHLLPGWCANLPMINTSSRLMVHEVFGTRHEATRDPSVGNLLVAQERKLLDEAVSKKKGKKETQSSQMIYTFQGVMAGSRWAGSIHYKNITDLEFSALVSALYYAAGQQTADGRTIYTVGGKSAVGFGKMGVHFSNWIRDDIGSPSFTKEALAVSEDSPMEAYAKHLKTNSEEIMSMLRGLVK